MIELLKQRKIKFTLCYFWGENHTWKSFMWLDWSAKTSSSRSHCQLFAFVV